MSEEQYRTLDQSSILKVQKENYGYACFTNDKKVYQENYPQIAVDVYKRQVPTTGFPKCIERTITKQTIKVLLRNSFMARKIFTFFVLEKFIIFTHNAVIISYFSE